MDDYRQRKELFVSNLNGTSLFETGSVVINICASYFLCQIVKCILSEKSWRQATIKNFFIEHVILIVPMGMVSTILSTTSAIFHIVIWFLAFIIYFLMRKNTKPPNHDQRADSSHSRIIEIFRGQIFLVTYLCILAVDFPIFPRRYAKTENFGYSGMDLGVGLFALAHGMVSSEARNKRTRLKDFLLENLILLILGLARLISVKSVSYVEHVSEYGVHWNFFLTLCLMKSIGNLLMKVIKQLVVLIICVLIIHEIIILQYFRYEVYLISSIHPRENFIDANREGIFSLGGYVSLYLIGVFLGRFIIDRERSKQFHSITLWMIPAMVVFCSISLNPSRKLCNFAYISSTTGLACMCLGLFAFVIWLLSRKNFSTESILLKNVNQKGLDAFLIANIITGIVNLTVRTLDSSSFVAFVILSAYMFIVSSLAYFFPSITKQIIKSFK